MSSTDDINTDVSSYTEETLQERFVTETGAVADLLEDSAGVYVMNMPSPGQQATRSLNGDTYVNTDSLKMGEIPEDKELSGSEARNLYDQLQEEDLYQLVQTREGTVIEYRDDLSEPAVEFSAVFRYEGAQEFNDETKGHISFAGVLIGDDVIGRYVTPAN